ncbi:MULTISPECIES: DUF2339 domain-containing protein [Bacillaceae]|uniref:DUF2339 domain-containing protein n=1 Tax=Evansella alkalicola TaxID=745819 RepID=A0ABS6K0F1_9BACI|nr:MULTISPECIES: DUF2339 domain-containing protein [Bacillaceae]MBU9722937.1 DUF2339 domain-containing protein [Bacillus alkalicola]
MDEYKERLQRMIDQHNILEKELESALKEYESHDFMKENKELREKYEEFKKQLQVLKEKEATLRIENGKLRSALQEQILDEKLSILKVSQEKLDTYFQKRSGSHKNELQLFEEETQRKIDKLVKEAEVNLGKEKHQVYMDLKKVSHELNERIAQHRAEQAKKERELLRDTANQFLEHGEGEIPEEVIQKRIKQNQVEMKIGLNWINRLGILLIILGVGAAFRYSYANWFNDYFKGGLFFLLGLIMIAGGEFFSQRQKRTFALGLLGGGIGVLYGSIFFSYFLLEIIGLFPALLLSVLVTATAVVLSVRYQSRTICSFGLIGGYLPLYSYILAFGLEGAAVYMAMGYLLILNLSILIIAFQKHWTVVHYISFAFNIPSMFVLIALSSSDYMNLIYSVLTFLMYLGITIAYSFTKKVALKLLDVILLGLNTFISCVVLYWLFNQLAWDDFRGLLALIFSVVYVGLGKFVMTYMPKERITMVLFYGTALTFAILMIPFQFQFEWVVLGWLIEGVVLIAYAHWAKIRSVERAGWLIFVLCLSIFYIEAYWNVVWSWDISTQFNLKYFSVMLGMLLIMVYYLLQQQKLGATANVFPSVRGFIDYYKYFVLGNLWFYMIYQSRYFYYEWVPVDFTHFSFYEWMMMSFLTIGLSYALTKIPLLYDRTVKYYCLVLYGIGSFLGLMVTMFLPTLQQEFSQNTTVEFLALGLLIVFNVLVFFSGRDLLLTIIRQRYQNLELYPLILGVYLLGVMAAFLTVQFHLGDVSLLFTSVFLVMAISYISYGFMKKFVYIRRLGLGLTILSTGKLILYDLSFLTEGSKIIAYFSFGVALLGISYMYQKVSSQQDGQSKEESGKTLGQ